MAVESIFWQSAAGETFGPRSACWHLQKSQNAVLYIAVNGKIVMGVALNA